MSTENALLETQTTPEGETPQPAPAPPALTGKRANWTIAHKIEGESIMWQVKGAGNLVLDTRKLSEQNRLKAMLHGMVQRVSDAAAMARDPKTGASATAQEKFEAMKKLVEHYQSGSGEWSPARVIGERVLRVNPQVEVLIRALRIHSPSKDQETVEKFVKGLTQAQVSALVVSEQLKEAVELAREELREKERASAAGVDAQELLKGL